MRLSRTFTRTAAAGAAGLAAAAVAAGMASAAPVSATATKPCKSPAKFKGEYAEIYVEYCEVCQDTGWKQIRTDYILPSKVPARIAYLYAAFDHKGSVRPPAAQGCQRGFALRGRP